ncbi:type I-C CRISPR-associated protein Cas7/Csd2 [soil metagenome]
MSDSVHLDPARRHDFVFLFDVTDGNPNGDPDAGNLPRIDPETLQGLVTDVSIKRKVRNFVDAARGSEERFKIYVQNRGVLNAQHRLAYDAIGKDPKGTKQDRETIDEARAWMCANFFDVRTFGAVMSTGVNAGQVRGPVQLTFSRSVDPVVPTDISITRVAVTKEEDAVKFTQADDGSEAASGKETEMGRKALIPYGLFRGHGFINPNLAEDTGFDADDLALFWQALQMGFEIDRSASRGLMALRGLYIFSHDSRLGNAPAHTLLERVAARRSNAGKPARAFGDYELSVDEAIPDGITLTRVIG